MSMVIANNMSAVNTKRQFGISARGQSGAMEKLSSGYKINTGKDDPAGLVVSEKLRSQLNGLKRAQQNTEEAINVMGIAEGALNEMNSILKKMKALAIHSNNTGVTSPDQIAADQAEMDSSIQTLDRIAQTTKFSSENLLNGSKDIAYDANVAVKGTQQNSILNARETNFKQIYKRDDYAVAINFTGSANAAELTGVGDVDFTKQAMKAYLEVDTSLDPTNTAQVDGGKFTQDQQFTLTGVAGSRQFTFSKGETVATMVTQIKSAADSTGIDAALVFNSDQKIDMTTEGSLSAAAEAKDQTFTISGVNTKNASNEAEAIQFTLSADKLKGVFEDQGIENITFSVGMDGEDVVLSATINGSEKLQLTHGWDGKFAGNSLKSAIEEQQKYVGINSAESELLAALADGGITMSGDIELGKGFTDMSSKYTFTDQTGSTNKVVLTNVFGAAGASDGNVTMDAKVKWDAIYEKLPDTATATSGSKQDFIDAAEGDDLRISLSTVAGTQDSLTFDILVDAGNAAATDDFYAQRVTISKEALKELQDTGETTYTMSGGVMDGTSFKITTANADLSKLNYTTGTNKAGVTADLSTDSNVVFSSTPAETKFFESAAVEGGTGKLVGTEVATAAWVGIEFEMTDVFTSSDGSSTKFKMTVGAGANTNFEDSNLYKYVAAEKLAGNTAVVKLSVALDEGVSEADWDSVNQTYSIIADVDGTKFFLKRGWDGSAATGNLDAQAIMDLNAGTGLTSEMAQLFEGHTITNGGPIDEDTWRENGANTDGFLAAQVKAETHLTEPTAGKLSFDADVVAGNIWDNTKANTTADASNLGKLEVRAVDVDLKAFFAAAGNGDLAGFVSAVDADKLGLRAEIKSVIDPVTKAAMKDRFIVELEFLHTDGTPSLGTVSLTMGAEGSGADIIYDANGETTGADDGWVKIANGQLAGLEIKLSNGDGKSAFENDSTAVAVGAGDENPMAGIGATATATAPAALTSGAQRIRPTSAGSVAQVGGVAADDSAAREAGTVTVFNNVLEKDADGVTDGTVEKGVSGVEISQAGADSIQLGMNTDGQGRIYVKFIDDNSFELYKDASMSQESLVAAGISGQEISARNNSGLEGFTLNMVGDQLTKVNGVYISVAGIEGSSTTDVVDADGKVTGTRDGVTYTGNMVGGNGTQLFESDRTYITGVELGTNTDDSGKIYMKTTYDAKTGTAQVSAYKDMQMRAEDLVAQSDVFQTKMADGSDVGSMTVILNEVRNADNTAGTGLGIVLSSAGDLFKGQTKDTTYTSEVNFTNLGARLFAQDYGSSKYVKITQDKGSIFSHYGSAGQNSSKQMIDAGSNGVTVQVNGQDATLSVNGTTVKTDGLGLSMATQDIQADMVFNEGTVGSTTIAQVGYGTGSIFTKIGALNLGSVEAETEGKYAGLSGAIANAGHVTSEKIENFQGGMQLQLGEGAGDQNRTVVAIKSLTSENLGRVTKAGYWEEGSAVYSERQFTMKDVMGGGLASLAQSPTLAISIIEQGISDVAELRAQIGAVQTNLLQTNSNNLAVTMENIQKTESGIRDADMADEMTEFTKNQVLQNAAMSMMSQANQSSQNVLQLLR